MEQIEDEEIEECDGCRFPGLELETYECSPFSRRKEPKRLCVLCASSFMGNAVEYPEQYPNHETMRMTAYCTNLILQRLKELEARLPQP